MAADGWSSYSMGVDIGVTNVKRVCVSAEGEILDLAQVATEASSPDWPQRVKGFIEQMESRHGRTQSVGIAAPGIGSPDERSIYWMQGRLGEIEGLDWTILLDRDQFVPVLNDALAALLGETWQGAAAGATNAILLTLGTGVGGAAMVEGKLLRGHLGRAGHFGHVSLDPDGPPDIANTPGSLEDLIGNCTIERRSQGRYKSTHDLIAAHASGDAVATGIWLRSVRALAAAVASFINILDPEIVIIGGGIARAGELLFAPLRKELNAFEWRPHGGQVKIVAAQLGEFAGALGAARNGMLRPSEPKMVNAE